MNGARWELVGVGGVLWVKDGHCLGVGHTLGYAWHSLACYLGIRHPLGYVWHSELTVLTNVRIYLGYTQYTFWPALIVRFGCVRYFASNDLREPQIIFEVSNL